MVVEGQRHTDPVLDSPVKTVHAAIQPHVFLF